MIVAMNRRTVPALVLSMLGCGGTVLSAPVDGATDGSSDDTAFMDTGGRPDAAVDTAVDAPTAEVAPPDTGVPVSPACAAAGGMLCTDHRWTICPKGYEPTATGDGHLGCGGGGWCCVAAPASTCSGSGRANCVVGVCTGCWSKVADSTLTCESGRSCCEDVCD